MTPPGHPTNDLLDRGIAEIIDRRHLEQRLKRRPPLRIKYGIDPTGADVHLGHAVPLRVLRALQDAGHQAVIIIGDYTARIGDPTGRDRGRVPLTAKQIQEYAADYLKQIGQIIDLRQAEIRHNSEWFEDFSVSDLGRLLGGVTVQQILAHDTFRRRLDLGQPLNLQEVIYPVLQGYDSVAVEADAEIGGLDQKFNLLMGREIQTKHQQPPQDVILTPYLMGLDGKQKMGKTANNYVAILDRPNDMFGKIMSIPDKLIAQYFELATNIAGADLADIRGQLKNKKTNPRELKIRLAGEIVTLYHDRRAADQAAWEFTKVFRHKKTPTEIPSIAVGAGPHPLINLLIGHQLVASRSEARRLIEQGGVKYNRQTVRDWESSITAEEGAVLQIGKRRFVRLTLER